MSYDPERITFFAQTDARGKNLPFGIKAKDRSRHVYVIGKTGMGKSTLLENMAIQDIRNGEGVAFIDPHGQTAETLLNYVPEERIKDVLYFAPFDMEHPVSFNVMEDVGPDKRHLVVSGLMSVFEKIWVDAWSARMAYILQNTLMALLEYPDSTLLGVNRMLSDKNYRKKVVDNIQDPSVKSFWVDEFAKYNERYMQEAGDAIKNKIGQFTANPLIRNIIGQPKSSFDIRKIMDEKKILIMNLSKGLVGETNANLLGSMLTTRIYLAAMSRADMPYQQLQQMPNFYFYVDEFQSFANATFADILSEARKYKLNLTIAHQYIEQMEEEVKNAVFGNVGTIISFRVGPFDAEVLETIFAPKFTAVDIVNLGFAQVYMTLMIDGIGSAPFSATTIPPLQHHGLSYKDVVVDSSRKQFAHGRKEVEEAIFGWHEIGEGDDKNKKIADSKRLSGDTKQRTERPKEDRGKNRDRDRDTHKDRSQSRSGVNDAKSSRSERPHTNSERPTKRPERDSEKKSQPTTPNKDLTELRSILATIAKPQNANAAEKSSDSRGPSASKEKSPAQSAAAADNKQDLRSVLAGVIGSATGEKPQSIEEKKESPSSNQAPKPGNAAVAQSVPIDTQPKQSSAPENTSELDPKQLERMMRVTTSDRSPLK
ncbi:type IV secretion system DNA-binding domain-containing protein [Candidatus Kaiserbacteria bacterium]|nr:type IV secretion system DNA-binding domain-containing protein [Candidatus Kaiserbacteria bacterium]MCB9811679.1 type IV secretion system DNA-binding domain-containing protein [Candidatus Nomurabacteria bacterium]